MLLSRIGSPIDQPQLAGVRLLPERGRRLAEISGKVQEFFLRELAQVNDFYAPLAREEYPVC